jgi:hypothetical protein
MSTQLTSRNQKWYELHTREKNPWSFGRIAKKWKKDRSTVVKVIVRMRKQKAENSAK